MAGDRAAKILNVKKSGRKVFIWGQGGYPREGY